MKLLWVLITLLVSTSVTFSESKVEQLATELSEFEGGLGEQSEDDLKDPCSDDGQTDLFNEEQITDKIAILLAYCEENNDDLCTDFTSLLPELKAIDKVFNKENDPIYLSYTFYLLSKLAEFGEKQSRDIDKELINTILESLKDGYGLEIPKQTNMILSQIQKIHVRKMNRPHNARNGQSQIILYAEPANDVELAILETQDSKCYEERKAHSMCVNLAEMLEKAGIEQNPEELRLNRLIFENKSTLSFQTNDTSYVERVYRSGFNSRRNREMRQNDPNKFLGRFVKDKQKFTILDERIEIFMNDLGWKSTLHPTKNRQRQRVRDYLTQTRTNLNGTLDIQVDGVEVSNNSPHIINNFIYDGANAVIDTQVENTGKIHVSPLYFDFQGAKIDFDHEGTHRTAKFNEGFILPGLELNETDRAYNIRIASDSDLTEGEIKEQSIPAGQMFIEIGVETGLGDWQVELPL